MDEKSKSSQFIDWNNKWSYPLQWIQESEWARIEYMQYCYRVGLALVGKPWKNLYKEELYSNIEQVPDNIREAVKKKCVDPPEGHSFLLAEAVQTRANQMAAGVDSYEYQINDPYQIIDNETEDRLAAQCAQDYAMNNLQSMAATMSTDLTAFGLCAILCTYDQEKERNKILRINPKNTWWDTMYSSTGEERFRGYSTMIPFSEVKRMIIEGNDEINYTLEIPDRSIFRDKDAMALNAKYENKKIETLNDLDIYVEDLNRLATSPNLQANTNIWWEYQHDLRSCYNTNWYRSFATNPKAKTNSGYHGNDVELTVMYDLHRGIEFKILNRRFVISMNRTAFSRDIVMPVFNPVTGELIPRSKTVHVNCPLIFEFESTIARERYPFPTCDLFFLLDMHDELCAWRAKRAHVSKLLSILRIETNGADASSLSGLMNIMGIVLDDIQGDVNSLMFDYSYDPIDSQIDHIEQTIKSRLNAYNQYDTMQMMGDRASAAESGLATSAIAQGLATHQNTIMDAYADIARLLIINRVVYSNMSEFPVTNMGNYSTISIQEMALDAIITVKSKLAKKGQERQIAANALALVSNFGNQLTPAGVGYFMEQAMYGAVPRKLAATFLKQPEPNQAAVEAATLQAQNTAQALQQNQMMYEQNPMAYEEQSIMDNYSPDEIDEIITGLTTTPEVQSGGVDLVDMPEQAGALDLNIAGLTPDSGSELANPNADVL